MRREPQRAAGVGSVLTTACPPQLTTLKTWPTHLDERFLFGVFTSTRLHPQMTQNVAENETRHIKKLHTYFENFSRRMDSVAVEG